MSDILSGDSIAIFIKVTECIFKPILSKDAQKKGFKIEGRGLRMPLDFATLSSAVHVERAMLPLPPNYIMPFCPPLVQILKETYGYILDYFFIILHECMDT